MASTISTQRAQKRVSCHRFGLLPSHVALKRRHKWIPTTGDRRNRGGRGGRREGRHGHGRTKIDNSAKEPYASH